MSNSTYRPTRVRLRRVVAVASAVVLCLTACTSKVATTQMVPSAGSPSARTVTQRPDGCATQGRPTQGQLETTFWLPDPAGGQLSASAVGHGTTAVVFVHEVGRTGRCGFWTYAQWLAGHAPVQAVLVDRCGYGQSTCAGQPSGDAGIRAQTQPAVDWARAHGARRVVLVGASGGGGDALEAAGALTGVSAVVDLSGDGNDTGASDIADAKRDREPTLFAIAPQDPYVPVATVQQLFDLVPAADKRCELLTTQTGQHGWQLLTGANNTITPFGASLTSWIQGRYARSTACRA